MQEKGGPLERWHQACDILVRIPSRSTWQSTLMPRNRQDQNSSVMTGSTRVFDHTTFSELRWTRDHSTPDAFILPSGFRDSSGLLGHDLVEILEDVHALQCIRDTHLVERQVMSMTNLDNHQASVQSRLHSLSACSSISDCCRLGAYLCSTTLRCKLWHDSTVPVSRPTGQTQSPPHR